ncbi:hypothetical protein TNCV_3721541 [Trichonephila clavipes]|nr:hypothetical protein TNCV_3721541 [Trichonephila clavipes]
MNLCGRPWPVLNQLRHPAGVLGSNSGEGMDACKCIVPLRLGGTLNSRRAASHLGRLGKGKTGGRPLISPNVFSLKIGVKQSQIVLSSVLCSKLRLTTGIHSALFHDEICRPGCDVTINQVA